MPSLIDQYLAPSGYQWDPSAFDGLCRDFRDAEPTEVESFVAAANQLPHWAYLQTVYWGMVRGFMYRWKGGKCENCGAKSNFNLHHRTYEHKGRELKHFEDLELLCKRCHEYTHGLAGLQTIVQRLVGNGPLVDYFLGGGSRPYGVDFTDRSGSGRAPVGLWTAGVD